MQPTKRQILHTPLGWTQCELSCRCAVSVLMPLHQTTFSQNRMETGMDCGLYSDLYIVWRQRYHSILYTVHISHIRIIHAHQLTACMYVHVYTLYIMYADTAHCDLEEGMDAEGVVWNMDWSAWNGDCSGMEGSRPATDSCIVRNLIWLPWREDWLPWRVSRLPW